MIIDLLVHIIFQVILSVLLFWYVVVPITKRSVDKTLEDIIDKTIQKQVLTPGNLVIYKEYLVDYLSKKDQYAYEQNTHVLKTSFILIITTLFICFTLMYLFACNQNPLPIFFELFIVYFIVVIVQIFFVILVLNKYTPVTYNVLMEYISTVFETKCSKE
jgi:hypothetical protein